MVTGLCDRRGIRKFLNIHVMLSHKRLVSSLCIVATRDLKGNYIVSLVIIRFASTDGMQTGRVSVGHAIFDQRMSVSWTILQSQEKKIMWGMLTGVYHGESGHGAISH